MQKNILTAASIGLAVLSAGLSSCKSDSKKENEKEDPRKEYYGVPQHNEDSLPSELIHPGMNNNASVFRLAGYSESSALATGPSGLIYPQEKHFKSLKQLTFGGNNAEAYFSFDNKSVTFQSDYKGWGVSCDQIFLFDLKDTAALRTGQPPMVSTGKGRTTCSYFMPGNKQVLYASTHKGGDPCPPPPARRADHKYLWPIYDTYDIFTADRKGKIKKQLTNTPGYDAEATVSPKGDKIVFTSDRSGDLELWIMDTDGKNQKQITSGLGYDGGAFFSPDGKKLVFRASRPKTEEEIKEYKDFLKQGLVSPTRMEIYTCNIDGSDLKQITNLGNANWAPFFHPSGNKILFCSNHKGGGYKFNLYMINTDGTGLEQVTYDPTFDAFPMFSFDGKLLIFSSNRNNGGTRDTNVFLAEWMD